MGGNSHSVELPSTQPDVFRLKRKSDSGMEEQAADMAKKRYELSWKVQRNNLLCLNFGFQVVSMTFPWGGKLCSHRTDCHFWIPLPGEDPD